MLCGGTIPQTDQVEALWLPTPWRRKREHGPTPLLWRAARAYGPASRRPWLCRHATIRGCFCAIPEILARSGRQRHFDLIEWRHAAVKRRRTLLRTPRPSTRRNEMVTRRRTKLPCNILLHARYVTCVSGINGPVKVEDPHGLVPGTEDSRAIASAERTDTSSVYVADALLRRPIPMAC